MATKHDEAWQANLEELKKFKKEKGHFKVPLNNVNETSTHLGSWVNGQRNAYKKGKLPQNRIDGLSAIGFCWDPLEEQWLEKFGLLQQYKQEKGDCLVLCNHKTLGPWVSNQRQQRKKGELNEERIQKLDSLGFVWEASRGRRRHEDSSRSSAQAASGADRKRAAENPELSNPNPKRTMQGDIRDEEMDRAEQGMVITNLKKELDEKNQSIADQKTHLEHKDKTIADHKADLASKDSIVANLKKDLDQKDKTIANLNIHLDHKDETIAKLTKQLEHIKSEGRTVSDKKQEPKYKDAIITKQKENLHSRIQVAEKQVDELKRRNRDSGLHKERHMADLRELREQIASLVKR